MIASWMMYCVIVSAAVGASALLAERAIRLWSQAGRWVWFTALCGVLAFAALPWILPARPPRRWKGGELPPQPRNLDRSGDYRAQSPVGEAAFARSEDRGRASAHSANARCRGNRGSGDLWRGGSILIVGTGTTMPLRCCGNRTLPRSRRNRSFSRSSFRMTERVEHR